MKGWKTRAFPADRILTYDLNQNSRSSLEDLGLIFGEGSILYIDVNTSDLDETNNYANHQGKSQISLPVIYVTNNRNVTV
jgi:hypothetical protein